MYFRVSWCQESDKAGECNARLILSDDEGDNSCTFRCTLPLGHESRHQEQCRYGKATMQWEEDDRITETWSDWCLYQWELAGAPEEWTDPPMPENWDWQGAILQLEKQFKEEEEPDGEL